LGFLSSQYNRGSLALAEQTACRIDDLMAKIGDSIMIREEALAQHLVRKLYVAVS
jgi:hypothetical protein